MSSFTRFSENPLMCYDAVVSDIAGKDMWRIPKGFSYYVNEKEDGDVIEVFDHFLTDGASVPRIFWSLIPPWGRYGAAAIVHDYLCDGAPIRRTFTYVDKEPIVKDYYPTRKEIDQIFNQAMKVLEVPKWKRLLMYASVRAFSIFRKHFGPKNGGTLDVH